MVGSRRRPAEGSIAELRELDRLVKLLRGRAVVETLRTVWWKGRGFPIKAVSLGAPRGDAPVLVCVGGVHGLERIGCGVVLGFLQALASAGSWDRNVEHMLESMRVLFLPVLNPIGVMVHRRSNGNGVDLMRNAPVDADGWGMPGRLYRGQRLSRLLPWFRGDEARMEPEAEALCEWLRRETFCSSRVIAVDVHSGFFGADRLWFPYARTRALFPHAAEALAVKRLLDATYPRHRYVVEPQATQYTTHGDLWDYLYDQYRLHNPEGIFMPFTLELGASSWLKKSWRLFDKAAFFHPLVPHRTQRVLRRHVPLFEFLMRALFSWGAWGPTQPALRRDLAMAAEALWQAS